MPYTANEGSDKIARLHSLIRTFIENYKIPGYWNIYWRNGEYPDKLSDLQKLIWVLTIRMVHIA